MSQDATTAELLLPPSLDKLAQAIGVDACLKLAAQWPGVRVYVPPRIAADHPIAQCIGLEAAQKLADRRGNLTFSIPRNARYLAALRRQRAMQRYHAGESAAVLARELGVHEFTIYNWSQAERRHTANGQPCLF